MPKKQSTKQRTQVKDLPKKGKKLSTKEMKKVKGGYKSNLAETTLFKSSIQPVGDASTLTSKKTT